MQRAAYARASAIVPAGFILLPHTAIEHHRAVLALLCRSEQAASSFAHGRSRPGSAWPGASQARTVARLARVPGTLRLHVIWLPVSAGCRLRLPARGEHGRGGRRARRPGAPAGRRARAAVRPRAEPSEVPARPGPAPHRPVIGSAAVDDRGAVQQPTGSLADIASAIPDLLTLLVHLTGTGSVVSIFYNHQTS